jgi:hypothetical protein
MRLLAVERGQISPQVDLGAMASALRGPLYFRRWFTRDSIDARFMNFVVRGCMAAVAAGSQSGPDAPLPPEPPNA